MNIQATSEILQSQIGANAFIVGGLVALSICLFWVYAVKPIALRIYMRNVLNASEEPRRS